MNLRMITLPLALAAAAVGSASMLTGCVPVVAVAAIGGAAVVATDRRSAGAQLDDESIELKIGNAISANHGSNTHVAATSYNGIVLLTGQVPDERARESVASLARSVERVRSVQNETTIGPPVPFGDRSNDALITSKVKTRLVEANEVPATQVKVVTERGVVYLMGLVTRAEGDSAARLAAQTGGVVRVVRVFEYI